MAGVLDWNSTMIGAISLSLGDLRLGDLSKKEGGKSLLGIGGGEIDIQSLSLPVELPYKR